MDRELAAQQDVKEWRLLLVDGTGFGFEDARLLAWRRGEALRQVRAHICLVILALVDERGRSFWLGAAVGSPYVSEIQLFRQLLAAPPAPRRGRPGL